MNEQSLNSVKEEYYDRWETQVDEEIRLYLALHAGDEYDEPATQ